MYPVDEDDLSNYKAKIMGPDGSPYEGGIFHLTIKLSNNYPMKAPSIIMNTKIYHPNININGKY